MPVPVPVPVHVRGKACPDGVVTAPTVDYLCSIHLSGGTASILMQATPVGVDGGGTVVYDAVVFHKLRPLVDVFPGAYVPATRTHSDGFTFIRSYDADGYAYGHSSFGADGLACQPPDCASRVAPDGTMVDDGCGPDRSRPEYCVLMTPSGLDDAQLEAQLLPDLAHDRFAPCTN